MDKRKHVTFAMQTPFPPHRVMKFAAPCSTTERYAHEPVRQEDAHRAAKQKTQGARYVSSTWTAEEIMELDMLLSNGKFFTSTA